MGSEVSQCQGMEDPVSMGLLSLTYIVIGLSPSSQTGPPNPVGSTEGPPRSLGLQGGECLGAPTFVSVRRALLISMSSVGDLNKIVLEDRAPWTKKMIDDHQVPSSSDVLRQRCPSPRGTGSLSPGGSPLVSDHTQGCGVSKGSWGFLCFFSQNFEKSSLKFSLFHFDSCLFLSAGQRNLPSRFVPAFRTSRYIVIRGSSPTADT